MEDVKWYEKKNLVIGLLIVFWPVGLYGMFKGSHFEKKTRAIITGIIAVIMIAFAVSDMGGKTNMNQAGSAETGDQSTTTAQPSSDFTEAGWQQCAASFGSYDLSTGSRLINNPPLRPDNEYYSMVGHIESVDGKYYLCNMYSRTSKLNPRYFSFKLHKKLSEPPFKTDFPVQLTGKFVDLKQYRTMEGERVMPVFEVVCVRIFG